ncbi:MAG: hypothetical protein K0S39_1437 [Paenibacillus sp.]|nr:hypothetical protein [Paenibacillus sp.]
MVSLNVSASFLLMMIIISSGNHSLKKEQAALRQPSVFQRKTGHTFTKPAAILLIVVEDFDGSVVEVFYAFLDILLTKADFLYRRFR